MTRGERHFRHLSVDAMMLADPKPQLAVPTGHPGVSLEALAVAYGVDLASSVWAAAESFLSWHNRVDEVNSCRSRARRLEFTSSTRLAVAGPRRRADLGRCGVRA